MSGKTGFRLRAPDAAGANEILGNSSLQLTPAAFYPSLTTAG